MNFPNFITHYNRSLPFRSLSSVSSEKLPDVLKELNESNTWGLNRFSDSEYLKRRVIVEARLRKEFIAKGGRPVLDHPIYFFLGRNEQFEKHKENIGYSIQLEKLPKGVVSFTYGDSMFSLNEDYRILKGQEYQSELCPHVYNYEDLSNIFTHPDYKSPTKLHIEAQLWITPSDAMIFR